jgi:hypothetical protein
VAKRKPKKKEFGVKALHLPKLAAYFVAGAGVIVLVVFFGYLFVKGSGIKKEENTQEKARWARDVNDYKSSGILLAVSKDPGGEGVATVSRTKWDKLPFDSREALAIAVARAEEIKTLQLKDETGFSLGVCRNGIRLWENKEQTK